jgi:hypothetical protein
MQERRVRTNRLILLAGQCSAHIVLACHGGMDPLPRRFRIRPTQGKSSVTLPGGDVRSVFAVIARAGAWKDRASGA